MTKVTKPSTVHCRSTRTLANFDTRGFIKLVAEAGSGRDHSDGGHRHPRTHDSTGFGRPTVSLSDHGRGAEVVRTDIYQGCEATIMLRGLNLPMPKAMGFSRSLVETSPSSNVL